MDFYTLIIAAGALVGYGILNIAIKKLFNGNSKNIDESIKKLYEIMGGLSEKYVLYSRYKEDYDKIEKKIDELVKLYYEDR